jgi:Domain of unknown function (DUF222)
MSELLSGIDTLATVDVHSIPEPALLVALEELLTAKDRLDAVIALHLQAADVRGVTVNECGRTTRSWLIEDAHLGPAEASRRLALARDLPTHPQLRTALLAGDLSHHHAQVITHCLRMLPGDWREAAEPELIEAARWADPTSLGRLCRELRIRSGADEDAEAAAVRMHESRWARTSTTFDGMLHVEAMLDPEAGATLLAAIAPLLVRAGDIDERSTPQRRADALTELAHHTLAHAPIPDHNGERPTVTVTIPYHELRDQIRAGMLAHATANQTPISPETARRIACDAHILPVVLGGPSETLDYGRTRRTWTKAQRRAAALRDKGCVFSGCQAPLSRCQLHHTIFWTNGGPTDLHHSAYLCTFHHWLVHHTNWTITRNPHGTIEIRRT